MAIYVEFDSSGVVLGFYDDDINPEIPANAAEVTEAERASFLNNQDRLIWDVEAGGFIEAPPVTPPSPTADMVKEEARKRLSPTDWYVIRASDPSDGSAIPQNVKDYRSAVRSSSDSLEAMSPIPVDYQDDSHWPAPV